MICGVVVSTGARLSSVSHGEVNRDSTAIRRLEKFTFSVCTRHILIIYCECPVYLVAERLTRRVEHIYIDKADRYDL